MKQGINFILPVKIAGFPVADMQRVEFIFKRRRVYELETLKKAVYPGEVTYSEDLEKFLIPWTQEETYLVPSGASFYMDTRIHVAETMDMPETNIVELVMSPTLFAPDDKEG